MEIFCKKNFSFASRKVRHQGIRVKMLSTKVRDQERKLQEQHAKLQDQETTMAEMKKHMDEWDQKFSDFTGELTRAREDLTAKTAGSAAETSASFFKTNIRPRMAQIRPPLHYADGGEARVLLSRDLERKRKSDANPEVPTKIFRNCAETEKKEAPESLTSDIGSFITSSLETILKTPITGIRARKRKLAMEAAAYRDKIHVNRSRDGELQ